jgi:hypothetical protein
VKTVFCRIGETIDFAYVPGAGDQVFDSCSYEIASKRFIRCVADTDQVDRQSVGPIEHVLIQCHAGQMPADYRSHKNG